MRSTSKGDMSSERELGVGWFPSMGGNSRRVPSCPTNHPSTCALSVTAAAALTGMAGDGGGPRLSLFLRPRFGQSWSFRLYFIRARIA